MIYYLSDATIPLKYNSCGNLISKQEFQHHKRSFDIYVLILVNHGVLYINQNGKEYEIKENQYIFLNKEEEHYGYKASVGDLSYFWVHFVPDDNFIEFDTVQDIIDSNEITKYYLLPEYGEISFANQAFILFNQLIAFASFKNIYSTLQLNYALSLLIMEISREFVETLNSKKEVAIPSVVRIKEWIVANYYKSLSVKDIAEEFGYNPDYISYMFKKNTNDTLINYINKTRIEISKSLIINQNITIKEVAYSCGFTDDKYFSKTFKKYTGISPMEYKKTFNKY